MKLLVAVQCLGGIFLLHGYKYLMNYGEWKMENILDFMQVALPWIAMGLLVAVFAARSASQKRKKDEKNGKNDNYGTEGMCLGMCLGTAIGTALDNNTGIGISLGMLIGLAIGTSIKKENDDSDAS